MAIDDNARPGVASGTGGKQVKQTKAKVPHGYDGKRRRVRRVEIDSGPGWSVVGWLPVDEATDAG